MKQWIAMGLVFGVMGLACNRQQEPEFFVPFERPGESSEAMQWFQGDLHVHSFGASNDASARSTPERIREVAMARGLDFVVLTDHSNSTGSDPYTREEDPRLYNQGPEFPHWDRVAGLSDEEFILVQGNEISPVHPTITRPTGHVGCIPRSLTDFDPNVAFVDRPRGEVPGAKALRQAAEVGCLAILNHPYGPNWISYDWTSYEYEAMEVWNGGAGFAVFDAQGMAAWACDISQGRRVTAIGASDNHKIDIEPGNIANAPLDPALGVPVTWVWAKERDWDEIIEALSVGRVAISDTGHPLEIDGFDADGRWLAMAGEEMAAGEGRFIRLRGARQDGERHSSVRRLELIRIVPDACEDTRAPNEMNVPEPNWEVVQSWSIAPGESFDERVQLTVQPGEAYFAWMVPERIAMNGEDVAISGAMFVR